MISLFISFIFLAGAILAKKFVLQTFSPLLFVGMRMLPAGIILLAISSVKRKIKWKKIFFTHGTKFLLIALFTALTPSLLKAYAIAHMPASKAVLLSSIGPFVTAFYAYLLWNEKLSVRKIIGILMGMLGIVVLLSSHSTLEATLKTWAIFSLPELAGLAAVLASRYGWIMVQTKVKSNVYTPMEVNGIIMTIAGIIALATALACGHSAAIFDSSSLPALYALLYAIIGGNVIGYTLYTKALKKHSATLVSLCGFSLPILVTAGGILFFGEIITGNLIVAAVLLFAGIALFYTGHKNKTEPIATQV